MRGSMGMSRAEWAQLVLLSVLWGGSFFFSKIAVTALPPVTIVFLRFASAALLVYAYARARSIPIPRDISSWLSFAGMGLLNNLIPASLIVWGQTMIPSGLASVIIATTPIFSIIAIHLSSADEPLNLAKISGMVLGLAGVFFLFRLGTTHAADVSAAGVTACLGAALSYGLCKRPGEAVSAPWHSTGGGRDGADDRYGDHGISPDAMDGSAMGVRRPECHCLGLDGRPRGVIDRIGLCGFLPDPRNRGSYQHLPRDLVDPRHCCIARLRDPRRTGVD